MIGFLDENSLRFDPGKRRDINTPFVVYSDKGKVYDKRSMALFGFMSLKWGQCGHGIRDSEDDRYSLFPRVR